jgi:hypothetical protein
MMMMTMMYEVQQTVSASNITNHYSIVNRNKERTKKPSAFSNGYSVCNVHTFLW